MVQGFEVTFANMALFVLLQGLAWVSFCWLTTGDMEHIGWVSGILLTALHALALIAFRWLTVSVEGRLIFAQVALLALFHVFAYLAFVWLGAGTLDDRDERDKAAQATQVSLDGDDVIDDGGSGRDTVDENKSRFDKKPVLS